MNVGPDHLDAIRELVNIGVGRAAGMLNEMTSSKITLRVPEVEVIQVSALSALHTPAPSGENATIRLDFSGFSSGMAGLTFSAQSAASLVAALTGESSTDPELDAIRIEALKEVGNIIINGVMGSISNILDEHLHYSIPVYVEKTIMDMIESYDAALDERVLLARTSFFIEDLNVEGTFVLLLEIGSFDAFLKKIDEEAAGA